MKGCKVGKYVILYFFNCRDGETQSNFKRSLPLLLPVSAVNIKLTDFLKLTGILSL